MKTLTRKEFKELLKDPEYPVIGLAGHSRVGKSYWAQRAGRVRFSFAEPIKDIYKAYTEKHELPKGINKREFHQTLGTNIGRSTDKGLWSDILLNKIFILFDWCREYNNQQTPAIIIDDIRFQSEIDAVRHIPLKTGIVLIEREGEKPYNDHISETLQDIDKRCVDFFYKEEVTEEQISLERQCTPF